MVFRRLFIFQPQIVFKLRHFCDYKKLSAYYTGDGDRGTSKTSEGGEFCKGSKIFKAIGATEELLSYLGLARAYAQESEHEYSDKLKRIQTIIIDLNTAITYSFNETKRKFIPKSHTTELEEWIREYEKELPPPEKNIIPGGGVTCASLHVTRAICRKTERVVVPLVKGGELHNEALIYLNRLSDFLFIVARIAAKLDKRTETIYIPKPDGRNNTQ